MRRLSDYLKEIECASCGEKYTRALHVNVGANNYEVVVSCHHCRTKDVLRICRGELSAPDSSALDMPLPTLEEPEGGVGD